MATLAVGGCDDVSSYYPTARHVIAQVCQPSPVLAEHPGFVMHQVAEQMIAGESGQPAGLTRTGQSVRDMELNQPGDVRFLVFEYAGAADSVYTIPRKLDSDAWTAWLPPDYLSTDQALMHKLLRSQVVADQMPPAADAPRVRYRVMTTEEHDTLVKVRKSREPEHDIPPC